jgi:hypothetical protein
VMRETVSDSTALSYTQILDNLSSNDGEPPAGRVRENISLLSPMLDFVLSCPTGMLI